MEKMSRGNIMMSLVHPNEIAHLSFWKSTTSGNKSAEKQVLKIFIIFYKVYNIFRVERILMLELTVESLERIKKRIKSHF